MLRRRPSPKVKQGLPNSVNALQRYLPRVPPRLRSGRRRRQCHQSSKYRHAVDRRTALPGRHACPGVMLPRTSSWWRAKAALTVKHRSASSTPMPTSGPMIRPDSVARCTITWIARSGAPSVTAGPSCRACGRGRTRCARASASNATSTARSPMAWDELDRTVADQAGPDAHFGSGGDSSVSTPLWCGPPAGRRARPMTASTSSTR
jgi:hypothetical protein